MKVQKYMKERKHVLEDMKENGRQYKRKEGHVGRRIKNEIQEDMKERNGRKA